MSNEPAALIPSDVRNVDFYGDAITGAIIRRNDTTQIYVPVRPICAYLGLDWSSQRQRLNRDEVLAEGVVIITIPSAGGPQNALCLPLDLLPGWLFGITPTRVRADLREKITRYRRDCFRLLWEQFRDEIQAPANLATTPEPSGAQLAYELATAVQHLARQQIDFEQRLDSSARWAKGIEGRVSSLELQVQQHEQITEAEATEIAGAVRAVAQALEAKGIANSYQRVYGELYRIFSITSYKSLPKGRLAEALNWLRTWYTETSA